MNNVYEKLSREIENINTLNEELRLHKKDYQKMANQIETSGLSLEEQFDLMTKLSRKRCENFKENTVGEILLEMQQEGTW